MAVARAGAGAAAESSPGLGRMGRDPPWRSLESLFGPGPAETALDAASALGVAQIVWLGCCRWLRGLPPPGLTQAKSASSSPCTGDSVRKPQAFA